MGATRSGGGGKLAEGGTASKGRKEASQRRGRAGGRASPVGIIVDERRRLNCVYINPKP